MSGDTRKVVTLSTKLVSTDPDELSAFREMLESQGGAVQIPNFSLRIGVDDIDRAKDEATVRVLQFHLQEDGNIVVSET